MPVLIAKISIQQCKEDVLYTAELHLIIKILILSVKDKICAKLFANTGKIHKKQVNLHYLQRKLTTKIEFVYLFV